MSDTDKYFQFPLCALMFGQTCKDRLEHIISYGFFEAGIAMYRKLDADIIAEKAATFAAAPAIPKDFKQNNGYHVAAMIGAHEIGINVGSLEFSHKNWQALSDFCKRYEGRHRTDVQVRIRKDLVFEVRDEKGMSYREFAVLCAVYSCVGASVGAVRITKETIQARMLGYKSPKIMDAEFVLRKDKATKLTRRQIGYTLDELHERNFFARMRANERQTYFSHRLTSAQMEEDLFHRKTANARFHAARKTANSNLINRIKSERKRLAGGLVKAAPTVRPQT